MGYLNKSNDFPLSRTTYHCARSSEWGDRLPVEMAQEMHSDEESKEQEKKNVEGDNLTR